MKLLTAFFFIFERIFETKLMYRKNVSYFKNNQTKNRRNSSKNSEI